MDSSDIARLFRSVVDAHRESITTFRVVEKAIERAGGETDPTLRDLLTATRHTSEWLQARLAQLRNEHGYGYGQRRRSPGGK